jgi:predicted metal-binding membrane protein
MLLHGFAHPGMAEESPLRFALFFVAGWTLMTVAMMLPASVPLLVLFQRMVRGRATAAWLLGVVICGYLGVWLLVGVALQVVNWGLRAWIARIAWPADAEWIAAGVILTIAGLYQFSSLKHACLEKCRSPLSFLIGRWQGGNPTRQALWLGAEHGLYCVGCCWSLMLLMFVVGAGSIGGMLLLGVVMAVEKNFRWGRRLSAPLGVVLLAGGMGVLVAGGVR